MAGKQDKDIRCVVLRELKKKVNETRGTSLVLRTVDWIIDGKHYKKLENRELFTDQNSGEEKMGKAKGMDLADMDIIMDNWGEIRSDLGDKVPSVSAPKAEAPASTAPASAPAAQTEF